MKEINLKELTIASAHAHMMRGDFSAVELAEAYLKNIEAKNKELNAYLEVFDDVREQAQEADARFKAGTATVLTGIPVALKDNILVKGRRVSAASKILEGYVATYDSTVARKLKEAGVVLLGRANMDEFAMGSSTENSAFGPSKNPFDTSRVPGGSSGGVTVAVASDMALVGIGTDTGGSVRQPASFCGLVGLKNTYGSISRSGLIAMGSSLDIAGPIAKTIEDVEILFDVLRGTDVLDSTSIEINGEGGKKESEKMVVGVPENFLTMKGIDPDVLENFTASIEKLRAQGCTIQNITLPTIPHSLAVYYIIMPAEVSTNLSRFDGVKFGLHKEGGRLLDDYVLTRTEGFGKEVRRRLLLGAYVLSSGYHDAYYGKAVRVRTHIEQELESVFKTVDVIATPTTPTPAFKIGEKAQDPLAMYLADIFTVPANIAGVPAVSLPSGQVKREGKSLPLGLHLMASRGNDRVLFKLGRLFEGSV